MIDSDFIYVLYRVPVFLESKLYILKAMHLITELGGNATYTWYVHSQTLTDCALRGFSVGFVDQCIDGYLMRNVFRHCINKMKVAKEAFSLP